MTRYKQRADGEGFEVPSGDLYRIACCDCGLVHEMEFAIGGTTNTDTQFNDGESAESVVLFRARRTDHQSKTGEGT